MDQERWQKVEEIFQTVADCDPSQRKAYLTQACAGDEALRREVESLIAHEVFDTFIQQPIKGAARSLAAKADRDLIGVQLGHYRITELIGEGGMGAVYAAARDDELFDQKVAVKVVKRGMDSGFVLSRFQAERRILASLDHPNIARLIDAGSTPDGRPYFVMEFIEGRTLNEYCSARQLSIADRIKLFRQICSAVQYAHQKLIAHRDIKPSNILVTEEGLPKLLDFGIAKLLDPAQLENDPARTATMMRMMTPDYASPEQVRGLQITAATDIYSLGAVLYELLTGARAHKLETYTPTEIERIVCETEVERPSLTIGQSGEPTKRSKLFRGDLDNIVLMAMRKEPTRRYASVEQFSDDLRRHLEKLPISARPDTIRYRASKFVRRHRVGVAATALVVASLLGGLIAANYQARRAERRFQQVRKLANTFLFDVHDKIQPLPGSTEARELMVKTALDYLDNLANESADDESLQLDLIAAYDKIGDVQGNPLVANLGHADAAKQSFFKAKVMAEKLAQQAPASQQMLHVLNNAYYKLGYLQLYGSEMVEARVTFQLGLANANRVLSLDPSQVEAHGWIGNYHSLTGETEVRSGDPTAALQHYRAGLDAYSTWHTAEPSLRTRRRLAYSYNLIGYGLQQIGDLNGALENFLQVQTICEEVSAASPTDPTYRRGLILVYHAIGDVLGNPLTLNLGRTNESLDYVHKSQQLAEEFLAADPKNTQAKYDLSLTYGRLAQLLRAIAPNQAEKMFQNAVVMSGKALDLAPENELFQSVHGYNLALRAIHLVEQNRYSDALKDLRLAEQLVHPLVAGKPAQIEFQQHLMLINHGWGDLLLNTGDPDDAHQRYQQAVAATESLAAASPRSMETQRNLADCYQRMSRWHTTVLKSEAITSAEKIDHWRQALAWQSKELAVWDGWTQHGGVSSTFDLKRREQVASLITESQTQLAKSAYPKR